MRLPAFEAELDTWRAQGLSLPLWWRDDDATEPTPALDRLLSLAEAWRADLHLAVIPDLASKTLADLVGGHAGIFVLSHGWRHANHAPAGQKKAEFGAHRPTEVMLREIGAGRERIKDLFAAKALPIFTPPWNRIAPDVEAGLTGMGFNAVSIFLPRARKYAAQGLLRVNTHLDPIAWKSGGGLVECAVLDAQLARDLAARRLGDADNAEPYGLLTHHLVQDEATWDFVNITLEMFGQSGVARWTSPLAEQ